MIISKVSIQPPLHEEDLATAYVTFNGVLSVEAAIYRQRNIPLKRSMLIIQWPDTIHWEDEYTENYINAEVLDRYSEFQDIHSKPVQLI